MANAHDPDGHVQDDRVSRTTPRWVKVSVAMILGLLMLLIVLHLTGNGFGMSMHTPMMHGTQP